MLQSKHGQSRKGKIESVRWARRVERMYREREREARAEIF